MIDKIITDVYSKNNWNDVESASMRCSNGTLDNGTEYSVVEDNSTNLLHVSYKEVKEGNTFVATVKKQA